MAGPVGLSCWVNAREHSALKQDKEADYLSRRLVRHLKCIYCLTLSVDKRILYIVSGVDFILYNYTESETDGGESYEVFM